MSITKEQRDEILRLVNAFDSTNSEIDYEAFRRYLDSLVAEPAEQPTRETERAALVAEVGDCCNGNDPLCDGGCLAAKAAAKRAGREQTTQHPADEARLHADDARAAMAAYTSGYIAGCISAGHSWGPTEVMRESVVYGKDAADAMADERNKRRKA